MAKVNWLARDYSNWDVNPPTLARMQTATFFIRYCSECKASVCKKISRKTKQKKNKIKKSSTHKIYVLLSVAGVTNKKNFFIAFLLLGSLVEDLVKAALLWQWGRREFIRDFRLVLTHFSFCVLFFFSSSFLRPSSLFLGAFWSSLCVLSVLWLSFFSSSCFFLVLVLVSRRG